MEIVIWLDKKPITTIYKTLINEYIKRFPKNWKIGFKNYKNISDLGKLSEQVFLMDENGLELNTREFSEELNNFNQLNLVIGPTDGFDDEIKNKYKKIRLSSFTMPRDLALAILIEQIYRIYTIRNNHPYHRE